MSRIAEAPDPAQSLMGPQPGVLVTVLDSIWKGWESVRLTAGSRAAAAACYQECLCHCLIQVRLAIWPLATVVRAYRKDVESFTMM